MTFRDRLLNTLRRLQSVLEEPGVLIVGSEVPNLLEPAAASTLVVSQDVDLAIPLERVESIKRLLKDIQGLVPSVEEPSVYVPTEASLIEANFLGLDRRIRDASETYVFEDPVLPLMVFGPLGLLRAGPVVEVDGLLLPLPKPADLMVEKLITDRTGEKGARDLLVVAGLLMTAGPADFEECVAVTRSLSAEARHAVSSGLTILSLMEGRPGMPDPGQVRAHARTLLAAIEDTGG